MKVVTKKNKSVGKQMKKKSCQTKLTTKKVSKPSDKKNALVPIDKDGYLSIDMKNAPVKGLRLVFYRNRKKVALEVDKE